MNTNMNTEVVPMALLKKAACEHALRVTGGSKLAASRLLGITVVTLRSLLKTEVDLEAIAAKVAARKERTAASMARYKTQREATMTPEQREALDAARAKRATLREHQKARTQPSGTSLASLRDRLAAEQGR
jgi:hypothetical protein